MQTNAYMRYVALVEVVAERIASGEQPNPDWLEEITAARAQHPEWAPPEWAPPPPVPPAAPTPAPEKPARAAVPLAPGERIPITVDEGNVNATIDKVLRVWGKRFCIFQMGGKLLELQLDAGKEIAHLARDVAAPRMVPVNSSRAWALAERECRFGVEKATPEGMMVVPKLAPEWLGRTLCSMPSWPHIPVFAGLAQAPTLRADGALIWEPGYDTSTGILLHTDLEVEIPKEPTLEDAKRARLALVDLLCDFEFAHVAGPDAWLATLCAICARHTYSGPTPMLIVDGNKSGVGKTMLADVISMIALGRRAVREDYVHDDVEMNKVVVSHAIAGDPLVLLDNVRGDFGVQALDALLTGTSFRGRVLARNEMSPEVAIKAVWIVTGNGMSIVGDLRRRALHVRLQPQHDHPEERTGPRPGQKWRYGDPVEHAREHRAELLGHVLTLVQAFIGAGRPDQHLVPMGSFRGWTDTIRSAIVWAGGQDPCATIGGLRETDGEHQALEQMIDAWPIANDTWTTAAELLNWAQTAPPLSADQSVRDTYEKTETIRQRWRMALLEWLPPKRGDLPTARELGNKLKTIRGTVVGTHQIELGARSEMGMTWRRVSLTPCITPVEG